jgi:hypothetical protein
LVYIDNTNMAGGSKRKHKKKKTKGAHHHKGGHKKTTSKASSGSTTTHDSTIDESSTTTTATADNSQTVHEQKHVDDCKMTELESVASSVDIVSVDDTAGEQPPKLTVSESGADDTVTHEISAPESLSPSVSGDDHDDDHQVTETVVADSESHPEPTPGPGLAQTPANTAAGSGSGSGSGTGTVTYESLSTLETRTTTDIQAQSIPKTADDRKIVPPLLNLPTSARTPTISTPAGTATAADRHVAVIHRLYSLLQTLGLEYDRITSMVSDGRPDVPAPGMSAARDDSSALEYMANSLDDNDTANRVQLEQSRGFVDHLLTLGEQCLLSVTANSVTYGVTHGTAFAALTPKGSPPHGIHQSSHNISTTGSTDGNYTSLASLHLPLQHERVQLANGDHGHDETVSTAAMDGSRAPNSPQGGNAMQLSSSPSMFSTRSRSRTTPAKMLAQMEVQATESIPAEVKAHTDDSTDGAINNPENAGWYGTYTDTDSLVKSLRSQIAGHLRAELPATVSAFDAAGTTTPATSAKQHHALSNSTPSTAAELDQLAQHSYSAVSNLLAEF